MARADEAIGDLLEELGKFLNTFRYAVGNILFSLTTLGIITLSVDQHWSSSPGLVVGLICYVLWLGMIVGFEIRLTVFCNTKAEKPKGLPAWALIISMQLQLLGWLALVLYFICTGVLPMS